MFLVSLSLSCLDFSTHCVYIEFLVCPCLCFSLCLDFEHTLCYPDFCCCSLVSLPWMAAARSLLVFRCEFDGFDGNPPPHPHFHSRKHCYSTGRPYHTISPNYFPLTTDRHPAAAGSNGAAKLTHTDKDKALSLPSRITHQSKRCWKTCLYFTNDQEK